MLLIAIIIMPDLIYVGLYIEPKHKTFLSKEGNMSQSLRTILDEQIIKSNEIIKYNKKLIPISSAFDDFRVDI